MSANMIVFDAEYTQQQVNNLDNAKRMLDEAIGILRKATAHRGWKCPEVSRINDKFDTINKKLGKLNNGMSNTIGVLNRGVQRFQELESRAESHVNNLSGDLKEKHGFPASSYGSNGGETKVPVTQVPKNDHSAAKLFLWQLKQTDKSGKVKLGSSIFSYGEALDKLLNEEKYGITGAKNLFNLSDKSVGVGKELYEYLKEKDAFSTKLGIVGDGLGLVSDTLGAVNKIHSENLGAAGVIGEVIGLGGKDIDIWSDVEKFKHLGDAATNITTKTGVYSPLTLYTAVGKGAVSTVSQTFKSIEKYSADGVWDLHDTAQTGIDSGVAGLYSIADTLTLGGLSKLGKVTGFTAENIASDIGNWANNVGKRAGNFIKNNSVLYDAYNHAGPIGKTALTFHAAFQSGIQSAVENIGNWFQSLFS